MRFAKAAYSHGVSIFLPSVEIPNPLPMPKRLPSGGPFTLDDFITVLKLIPRWSAVQKEGLVAGCACPSLRGLGSRRVAEIAAVEQFAPTGLEVYLRIKG